MILTKEYLIKEIDRLRVENSRLHEELLDVTGQLGYMQGKQAASEWETLLGDEDEIPMFKGTIGQLEELTLEGK